MESNMRFPSDNCSGRQHNPAFLLRQKPLNLHREMIRRQFPNACGFVFVACHRLGSFGSCRSSLPAGNVPAGFGCSTGVPLAEHIAWETHLAAADHASCRMHFANRDDHGAADAIAFGGFGFHNRKDSAADSVDRLAFGEVRHGIGS
jgi:hypothetical protein